MRNFKFFKIKTPIRTNALSAFYSNKFPISDSTKEKSRGSI